MEFYSPYCPHCRRLAPEYKRASVLLSEKDSELKMGRVDCTVEKGLCNKYKIYGYPTMWLFDHGKNAEKYEGERSAEAIVDYLIDNCH